MFNQSELWTNVNRSIFKVLLFEIININKLLRIIQIFRGNVKESLNTEKTSISPKTDDI